MDPLLKAVLDTTTSSGTAMQERFLNTVVTEASLQIAPLVRLLNVVKARGNPYRFKRRNTLPDANPEGDNSAGVTSFSTYVNVNVNLRIFRAWGGVTSFQESTTPEDLNIVSTEVAGQAARLMYEIEGCTLWGEEQVDFTTAGAAAAATTTTPSNSLTFQFTGFEQTNAALSPVTAHATSVQGDYDGLLDATRIGGATADPFLMLMSPQHLTNLSNILGGTNGNGLRYQPPQPVPFMDGGIRLIRYRGYPIYETDYCRPTDQFGTISLAAGSSASGTLTASGTYFYRVAPVSWLGEQLASSEASQGLTAAQNQVTITLTAYKIAGGSNAAYTDARYYKMYRGTVTGVANTVLRGTFPAQTYDSSGTPNGAVTSYIDLGNTGVQTISGKLGTDVAMTAATAVGAGGAVSGSRDETLFVIDREPNQGSQLAMSSIDNDQSVDPSQLVAYVRLSRTKDSLLFFLRSFSALAVRRTAANRYVRTVRAGA